MLKKAQQAQEEDDKIIKKINAKNQLESVCYSYRN